MIREVLSLLVRSVQCQLPVPTPTLGHVSSSSDKSNPTHASGTCIKFELPSWPTFATFVDIRRRSFVNSGNRVSKRRRGWRNIAIYGYTLRTQKLAIIIIIILLSIFVFKIYGCRFVEKMSAAMFRHF